VVPAPLGVVGEGNLMAPQSLAPENTVARGQHSDVTDTREVVVRSAAQWQALWQEHAPTLSPPTIDFAASTIVAVFAGERSTAGFDVEITGTDGGERDLTVTYRLREPASGDRRLEALTTPYHIVRIPRHDGPVRFRRIR
jgi:hypothetical protein